MTAIRAITRLQDADDLSGTPGAGKGWVSDGTAMVWTDLATQAELDTHAALTTTAHGGLIASSALDTDGALTANSDAKMPSQKAVKTYAMPVTATLDSIATAHATAADVAFNGHKGTGIANGTAATDIAAFGQIPVNWRQPSDYGLLAYNYPPPLMTASGGVNGTGIWHVTRIVVPVQITVASIVMWLTQAASGYTSSRNFAALWKLDSTLIAWCAEATCETAWSGTLGKITVALDNLIGGQSLTLAAGSYYVGFSALASTTPNFGRYVSLSGASSLGRTSAQGRDVSVTAAVAANTPPNTVSPLPALSDDTKNFWMGLV